MKNLLILIYVMVSSCGMYRQNIVNTPMFEQKGQLQLGGHYSFNGPEIQLGYSVTRRIGIMANYRGLVENRQDYSTDNIEISKHYFKEIGVGLYKSTKTELNRKIMDVFFLAGNGMSHRWVRGFDYTQNQITEELREAYYNRFCIQTDFGWITNKSSMCISPRIFLIDYYSIGQSNLPPLYTNKFLRGDLAFTLRYNISEYMMICGQSTVTIPITDFITNKTAYDQFSVYNMSIGAVLNLKLFKAK